MSVVDHAHKLPTEFAELVAGLPQRQSLVVFDPNSYHGQHLVSTLLDAGWTFTTLTSSTADREITVCAVINPPPSPSQICASCRNVCEKPPIGDRLRGLEVAIREVISVCTPDASVGHIADLLRVAIDGGVAVPPGGPRFIVVRADQVSPAQEQLAEFYTTKTPAELWAHKYNTEPGAAAKEFRPDVMTYERIRGYPLPWFAVVDTRPGDQP